MSEENQSNHDQPLATNYLDLPVRFPRGFKCQTDDEVSSEDDELAEPLPASASPLFTSESDIFLSRTPSVGSISEPGSPQSPTFAIPAPFSEVQRRKVNCLNNLDSVVSLLEITMGTYLRCQHF